MVVCLSKIKCHDWKWCELFTSERPRLFNCAQQDVRSFLPFSELEAIDEMRKLFGAHVPFDFVAREHVESMLGCAADPGLNDLTQQAIENPRVTSEVVHLCAATETRRHLNERAFGEAPSCFGALESIEPRGIASGNEIKQAPRHSRAEGSPNEAGSVLEAVKIVGGDEPSAANTARREIVGVDELTDTGTDQSEVLGCLWDRKHLSHVV